MNRRDLLKASLATGAAALATTADAAAPANAPKSEPPFEWAEASFAQLQAAMASGRTSSAALCAAYLHRIEALNPLLHAVLSVDPQVVGEAKKLDDERKAKGARGPLHGIPLLLKDNIETAGPLGCTAGSLALKGVPVSGDAPLVARLRAAGALVLGKSNLSEWANMRSPRSVSGWSGVGGLTRNPYALDRSALGSSSGSGAGAAANLCAGSLGSETNGSIIAPSSVHACVGLKPTVGLVSRTGVVPISSTQDTVGPITRTVEDAAALLFAIAGADPADAATTVKHRPAEVDYLKALKRDALRGARLGIVRKLVGGNDRLVKVFDTAVTELGGLGAVVVDGLELPDPGPLQLDLLLFELKATMADYLTRRRTASPHKGLAELIAFNRAHAEQELTWFGQEFFEQANQKGGLTDAAYLKAKKACFDGSRKGIDGLLRQHKLDALIGTAMGPAWNIDLLNGDPSFPGNDGYCAGPPAMAGYPSLTVPMGELSGQPVGLLFFGSAFSEAKLLAYAFAFEQQTKARRPPTLAAALPPLP